MSGVVVGVVAATDADGDALTYSVAATADVDAAAILVAFERDFNIDSASGRISVKNGAAIDFETRSSYKVQVQVSDSVDAAGNEDTAIDDTLTLTVTALNVDEAGAVTISGTPRAGVELSATLTDPDGSVSSLSVSWLWSRSGTRMGTFSVIGGATGASYTPGGADVVMFLKASASYTDGFGAGRTASGTAASAVEHSVPVFSTTGYLGGAAALSVAENSVSGVVVGVVAATDADGDALTYSVAATADVDAAAILVAFERDFNIDSASGRISVKNGAAIDFETRSSYKVQVQVSDSVDAAGNEDTAIDDTLTLTVTAVNVDEAGAVTISGTPRAGVKLSATLTDPDGSVSTLSVSWSWSRAGTRTGPFSVIGGAAAASYTPGGADVVMFLKASASYTDGFGAGRTASGTAASAVEHSVPVFSTTGYPGGAAALSVAENSVSGVVVGVVAATDADGDALTYSVAATADVDAAAILVAFERDFNIDSASGRISVKDGAAIDFETRSSYKVQVQVSDSVDAAGNEDTAIDDTLTLTVTALNVDEAGAVTISGTPRAGVELSATLTDPDGSVSTLSVSWSWSRAGTRTGPFSVIGGAAAASYTPGGADVVMFLKASASYTDGFGAGRTASGTAASAVEHSVPVFSTDDYLGGAAALSVAENSVSGVVVGVVAATDADGDALTYSVAATADVDAAAILVAFKRDFNIDSASGRISVKNGAAIDFETRSSYKVQVQVSDSVDAAGNEDTAIDDTLTLTVTALNVDEAGVVTISGTPRAGVELSATLTDPDGSVSTLSVSWSWSRSGTRTGPFSVIGGAAAASYTPGAADVVMFLKASATYTDGFGAGRTASGTAASAVEHSVPVFSTDDYLGGAAALSVAENSVSGVVVGVVAATDADGDALTYSVAATADVDAAAILVAFERDFNIDSASGRISVKNGAAIDFETRSSYKVQVQVSDSVDAAGTDDTAIDDTLTLTVTALNVDEAGAVTISGTPRAGVKLSATLTDPDGSVSSVSWSWSRSGTRTGPFSVIDGAAAASYTPGAADVVMFLKASASYTDGFGAGRTASGTAASAVLAAAGVTVVPGTGLLPVGEGGTGTYTVVLDSQPLGTVTVTAASADEGAVTVMPTSLTFTTGNWATAQTVTVRAVDDDNADDESVRVSHMATSSGDAAYNNLAGDVVTVTVDDDEVAPVSVSFGSSTYTVSEGGTVSVEVSLSADPERRVEIALTARPQGGADSGDYTAELTGLMFTSDNWDTAQTVTVTAVDDRVDDDGERVVLRFDSLPQGVSAGVPAAATVTIADNDTAGVTVVPGMSLLSSVGEGGTGTYTVVLASEPLGTVTVTAASGNTGAVTVSPTILTFTTGNWATAQTVTVTAEQDDNADDETVRVSHMVASSGDAVYDAVTAAGVEVEVADDGFPVVSVSFGPGPYTVSEDGMTASVTVSLSAVPYREVVISITVANQGDTSAGDYTAASAMLTFAADVTEQSFTFAAVDDMVDDDGERVVLKFGTLPDRVEAGVPATATVTIADNDTAGVTVVPDTSLLSSVGEGGTGTYTVVLASEPSGTVTVTATSGDTGAVTVTPPTSLTFTTGNWATAQTVTVRAEQDDNADDETVEVSHMVASTDDAVYDAVTAAGVSVDVDDDDTAGVTVVPDTSLLSSVGEGGTGTYTVVLASEPSGTVTVTATSGDTGAVTVTPPTSLTFTTGNWATAQTVTVRAEQDNNADDETVEVSHMVASTDDAVYDAVTAAGVSVDVTDDDTAGVTVVPDTSLLSSVGEGGTGTYTVVLASEPSGTVTVTATSGDTGAVTVTPPTSLTFTTGNWATAQTVTVRAEQDNNADDETVEVSHMVASTDDAVYDAVTAAGVSVDVTDDDTAGVTVVPDTSLLSSVGEGGTGTYTVVLASEPSGTVTVTATSADTGAVTVTPPTSLTFTTGNWATAQTVTVRAEQDNNADDETVEVSHMVASTDDAVYDAVTAAGVSVDVDDDDTAGVTVVPDTSLLSPVGEGGTGTYTVVLASEPSGTVTVTATSGDTGAVTVTPPTSLTFTTGNWATAQTVTVRAEQDNNADDETVEVSHMVASTDDAVYDAVTAAGVSVDVDDDDTAGVTVVPDTSLLSSVGEGGTGTYTVVLASEPSGTVTVTATSGDTGAVTVTPPTSLTFTTGNWATAQTVTVRAEQDDNADDETVEVSHMVASTDDAVYDAVTAAGVSVDVDDDDTAGVTVVPDTSLLSPVGEGGTGTYTVVLASEPSGTVTVTATSGDTGAVTVTPPTSLTFTTGNWATAQTVTVRAEQDDNADDETVEVSHMVASTDDAVYDAVTAAGVSVDVTDDDTAGVTVVPDTSLLSSVGEGGTGTYTVVLASEPSGTVTVTATSGDTGAVTVTPPTSLTFTTGNWATAQTVTVRAEQDNNADDETVEVSHMVASTDDAVYNLAGDVVRVTVTDDDTAGVTVVPDTSLLSPVGEGGTGTYTVVLASEPSGTVTVTATSGDTGAVTVTPPTSLTFTTGNWATAQTVTVRAEQDDNADDETVEVSHMVASTDDAVYDAVTAAGVSVDVTDDDTAGVTAGSGPVGVSEGGADGSYTVVLDSEPSGTVTVTATSDDTGAVTVSPTILTFTTGNWATAQTMTVRAVDDNNADDETVEVSHMVASTDDAVYNLAGDVVRVTVTDDDTAGVTAGSGPVGVSEGGADGSYTVVLDSEPSGTVTVTATSGDTGAVTVSPTILTFTTGNWATAQTVTVRAVDDNNADDETVEVSHTATSTDDTVYDGLVGDVVTVTVDDDEVAVVAVSFGSGTYTVSEGDSVGVSVGLGSALASNMTIQVTAAGGDGAVSSDFTAGPTSLVFTPDNWATAQTVTVTAVDDRVDDDGESVVLRFDSLPAGISAGVPATATVTIADNDTAGVTIVPDTSLLPSVDEGGTGTYTVVLDSEPSGNVTVTATSGDTGAVTVTPPTSLTFTTGNWATAQTVTVRAVDDDNADDETVEVSHTVASSDTAYNNLTGDVVTVTVTDDEEAGVTIVPAASLLSSVGEGGTGTYTVVLASEPSGTVTVTATSANTGAVTVTPTSLTFTTGNWATAQTVTVRAEQDDNADDETVEVSHMVASTDDAVYDAVTAAGVSVDVDDDDTAGVTVVPDTSLLSSVGEGGTGTYTVVLASEPSGTVTVTATSADTGAVTVSPTSLTFTTGNWATAQTVTVRAEQDNNADDETVEVSHMVASTDDAVYDAVTAAGVSVDVDDDDDAGVSVVPDMGLRVDEGGTGTYTVVLDSEPSGNVTVTATSGDTGAVTVTPPTILTFTTANWATAQTVTVRAVDDDNADDESVKVSHTVASSDTAYDGLAGDVVTVTVTDDEVAGVSAGSGPVGVFEGGADGSYTVVLDSEPSGNVTVTATSGDTGAVTVTSPTILTFTTGNWATAQTVTVRAVDDDNADDESVKVSHTAASSDTAYDGLAGDVVTVTVTDDEVAGVSAGSGPVGVFEGGADGSYTVVLDSEPSGTVTVTATSGDTGAVTVTPPTSLTFTTGNWATAQTVTVRAVDDDNADDESVKVSHTAASSDTAYDNLVGDVVTVTVTDDEVAVVAVSFGSDTYTVSEGGSVGVSVGLGSAPASNMTIQVAAEGGGGAVSSDFRVGPTSLVFTPDDWDTAQTVAVTAVDDRVDDDGESVVLRFDSLPAGVSAGVPAAATVTITDNDTAGVTIVPDTSLLSSVGEGGTATYTVVLASPDRSRELVSGSGLCFFV